MTEAFIPTCTAVRKQSRHSNSDAGLLESKDRFDGEDLGTNNVDASKPGTSTSIVADTSSRSQWSSSWQETLKMSPSSASAAIHPHGAKCLDKGLHAKHVKACFRRQVFLISANPDN